MTRGAGSSARGRLARAHLLQAAVDLVGERGWTAVTTRMLAERADVTAGLVHYHFTNLQTLLREAVLGRMREELAEARPALEAAPTAEAGIQSLFAALDDYTGHDPLSRVVAEAYLAASRDEGLRRGLAGLIEEFRHDLARWLAGHGHDRPEATASVLAAVIDGVLLHRALNPELTSAAVLPVVRKLLAPG